MPNIHDVAALAGVSPTLVSRYLNGKTGVGSGSRDKIEAAVKQLHYIPNGIARSLVTRRSSAIGIVTDSLCLPFMPRLISGFERAAEVCDPDESYNIIYCGANGNPHRKQMLTDYLIGNRVCGIIIYGSLLSDDATVSGLIAREIPLVLIENDMKSDGVCKVLIDNEKGAFDATEYLIKSGRRHIAHIAGDLNRKITSDRLGGYLSALRAYGIPVDPELIAYSDFDASRGDSSFENARPSVFFEVGCRRTAELLAKKKPVDAIFYASDLMAFGGAAAISEAGLSVPEDVSIFGFDDDDPSPYRIPPYDTPCPPLCTMRQPLEKAGFESVRLLFGLLNGENRRNMTQRLPCEMLIRDSVRPASPKEV